MSKKEFVVEPGKAVGIRLDVYLTEKMEDWTRSRIHKFIGEGRVRIGGETGKPGVRLKEGDRIEVEIEDIPEKSPAPLAENIPFDIIFSDKDIVVLDKPCGLVVHPGPGNEAGTLVNALLHVFPEIGKVGPEDRPGIVHRLDKETSGVMVAARSREAYTALVRQFKDREVRKIYWGLAVGKVSPPEGRLDWPIGRHPKERQKISIKTEHPREAVTHYRVLETMAGYSYLELRPVTGRTHQIRVHLAAAGHPLAGDSRYGQRRTKDRFPRLILHAHSLSLIHPRTGERMEFVSPLPSELESVLNARRRATR